MIIYDDKQLLDFLVSTKRFVAPFEDVKPSIFSAGIFQSVFIDGKHLVMLKQDFALFIESIKPICFDDKGEMEAFTNPAEPYVSTHNRYPDLIVKDVDSYFFDEGTLFIKLEEKKK